MYNIYAGLKAILITYLLIWRNKWPAMNPELSKKTKAELISEIERLQDSEKKYLLPDWKPGRRYWYCWYEWGIFFANSAACELFGVSRGELIGKSLNEFIPEAN